MVFYLAVRVLEAKGRSPLPRFVVAMKMVKVEAKAVLVSVGIRLLVLFWIGLLAATKACKAHILVL